MGSRVQLPAEEPTLVTPCDTCTSAWQSVEATNLSMTAHSCVGRAQVSRPCFGGNGRYDFEQYATGTDLNPWEYREPLKAPEPANQSVLEPKPYQRLRSPPVVPFLLLLGLVASQARGACFRSRAHSWEPMLFVDDRRGVCFRRRCSTGRKDRPAHLQVVGACPQDEAVLSSALSPMVGKLPASCTAGSVTDSSPL